MHSRTDLFDLTIQSRALLKVSEYCDPVVDAIDPVADKGDVYKNKHTAAWQIYFVGSYWRTAT